MRRHCSLARIRPRCAWVGVGRPAFGCRGQRLGHAELVESMGGIGQAAGSWKYASGAFEVACQEAALALGLPRSTPLSQGVRAASMRGRTRLRASFGVSRRCHHPIRGLDLVSRAACGPHGRKRQNRMGRLPALDNLGGASYRFLAPPACAPAGFCVWPCSSN